MANRTPCTASLLHSYHKVIQAAPVSLFTHGLHTTALTRSLQKDLKVLQRLFHTCSLKSGLPQGSLPLFRHKNKLTCVRLVSNQQKPRHPLTAPLYALAMLIFMIGVAYGSVPLYKTFCQQFGLGGSAEYSRNFDTNRVYKMEKVEDRPIRIRFTANTASTMQWEFKPQQSSLMVIPGETALAFYTARNPTDVPIIGISTYTVLPYGAAKYFHKIQCFCFEEQILNPKEQVDMPVFFFIDPEIDNDTELECLNDITLCYTFFEAKEGLEIPLPGFMKATPYNQTPQQGTQ